VADVQTENGFTTIANQLIEALIAADLSGQEFRIALLIIRKTYGFKKKEDAVSLSQMITATKLSKTRCSQVINRLQLQKIVTVTENINGISKKYKFNKDFDTWQTITKNRNGYIKVKSTVTENCNPPLRKTVSTKETLTKETIQKKYNGEFLQFWNAYPNKKEKPETFKRWKKLNGTRPPIEIILEAIKKQIEWRKNANGEFRPEWKNPATWLNKGCWDDELKTGGNNGQGYVERGSRVQPKEHEPEPRILPSDEEIERNLKRVREMSKQITGNKDQPPL
jgi:phage replication O-like protein O